MYQSIPKPPIPPQAIPGHLTRVKLRTVGNLTQMTPARWGIWLSCQNVCQRSETKGFRNSLIQHVSCVDGSLLMSIPRGFFCCCRFIQLYRELCLCLKHGAKTSFNKKFVVAENFAELVSKGKQFCLFPKVSDSVFPGGWGIWPSLKL